MSLKVISGVFLKRADQELPQQFPRELSMTEDLPIAYPEGSLEEGDDSGAHSHKSHSDDVSIENDEE